MTNKNNTSEYKNISQKLRDKSYLCDVDMDLLFDTFKQFYREGESNSVLFSILCDNLPDLRGTSAADEHDLLKALEDELKRQKNEEKWQRLNSDVFFRDEEGRHKINFEILIDNLWNAHIFKTFEDTEELLVYDNGIYRNATTLVKAYLERVLESKANKHIVSEMLAHLQRRSYVQREIFNANSEYIPLVNGLLNLESFKLEDFDSEKLYTFRIPVEYNAAAGYTHIIEFFSQVLHSEDIATMQELFGYVLYTRYPAHKSVWWLGKGRNGKTTTRSLLTELVGVENTAGVPLKQLDGNHRFAVARLFGKLVNIVAEPETKSAMQTPTFKAATGGDTIYGEWKNVQDDFPFVNFAKFVIYANRVPKIDDPTFAFWERVVAIEFPHTFTKDKAKKNHYKTLIEEDTLAGLLNWSIEGLKRLRKNNWEFTETETQTDAKGNMQRQAQPVKMFIEEWTEFDNRSDIPKASLFDAFKIYCDVYGLLVPDEGEFTRELKRNANVQNKRQNMEEWDISGRVLCWRGLKIKSNIDVVTGRIKTKMEGNDGTDDINERNIELEVHSLLGYLMCQGSHTSHTFSYLGKHIGEKTVIYEYKGLKPLYEMSTEITPDIYDHPDTSKNNELEIPPSPLPNLIKTIVIAATEEDERGAMELALINHVAKQFQFSVETVKEEIEKMFRDGELMKPSQDEYGEYVRVVECHPKKKQKPTRFINAKDDLDEDGNVIKKPKPEAPSEEKIKSDIEDAKRSLEESGLRESRDKEDSDSDEDNEKAVIGGDKQ